jgi:hypothetical protein
MHFEWATRQQREHKAAAFLIDSMHTRQLTAGRSTMISGDAVRRWERTHAFRRSRLQSYARPCYGGQVRHVESQRFSDAALVEERKLGEFDATTSEEGAQTWRWTCQQDWGPSLSVARCHSPTPGYSHHEGWDRCLGFACPMGAWGFRFISGKMCDHGLITWLRHTLFMPCFSHSCSSSSLTLGRCAGTFWKHPFRNEASGRETCSGIGG